MDISQKPQVRASPNFNNPPVVETALGVQFEELEAFQVSHFGLYYESIQDRFPRMKDQPRLEAIIEQFPRRSQAHRFQLKTGVRPERVWFEDEAGANLVQVQPDRFGLNWRKPKTESSYPRYSQVGSPRFLEEFRRFISFCGDIGLGEIKPNVCEVVYINYINPRDGETAVDAFADIFSGIAWRHSNNFLATPEVASLNRVYVIERNRGRLYAEASIASTKTTDCPEFVRLKMVGRVLCDSLNQVEDALQLAHDYVVHGFVSLTSEQARHERWEQQL